MKALSIRQPWAWLIVNGYKPVENRTWHTGYRGLIIIHAGKGMTLAEYDDCVGFAHSIDASIDVPRFYDLPKGGVVGEAYITDCVINHQSPWFFGPFGFVMEKAKILPFRPCKGSLGIFEV